MTSLDSPDGVACRDAATPARRLIDACWPWLLAVAASLVSLVRTGYNYNYSNNAFHIPVVLRFADLPQFANDPFILSLRKFVSPAYFLLSLVATEANVTWLFFVALAVVHLLTFYALLRIAQSLGIRSQIDQAIFVFLVAAARVAYGVSPVGSDALLFNAFSHSELARAFALLGMAELLRGRLVKAAAWMGLTFAFNAFMGVWTLVPLAIWALWHLVAAGDSAENAPGNSGSRGRWRTVLLAGLAFAVPAAPVLVWILVATHGQTVDFDFRAYLDSYFPAHFFLNGSSPLRTVQLAAAMAAGGLAIRLLPSRRTEAATLLASLVGVFFAGVVVGWFSHSRMILLLDLLRVDGMIVLLCAALTCAAVVVELRKGGALPVAGCALACGGLVSNLWPLVALGLALTLGARVRPDLGRSASWLIAWLPAAPLRGSTVLIIALVLACAGSTEGWRIRQGQPSGIPNNHDLEGSAARVQQWNDVQRWAQKSTRPASLFLTPYDLEGFRVGARRQDWVDWKSGATPMWAPETFDAWNQRSEEVHRLAGLAPALAYACQHGIDYVVEDLRPRQGVPEDPAGAVFLNRWFEVHAAHCDTPR
jgi:hypothetical protein